MYPIQSSVLTSLQGLGSVPLIVGGVLPSFATFTRATTGTSFDVDATLESSAINIPRIDHLPAGSARDYGLLTEEARTNSIRNSTMQGASDDPSTFPTNANDFEVAGLSEVIVGVGTDTNGMEYIDLKISGTPTATGTYQFFFESSSQIVAASGETWTSSVYVAIVGGDFTNTDFALGITERTDVGGFLTSGAGSDVSGSITSSLQRFKFTRTLSNGSTARVHPTYRMEMTNTNAVDFTVRLAAPQMELGGFNTSFTPTTTVAVARAADIASIADIDTAPWFNATEGTIIVETTSPPNPETSEFDTVVEFSGNGLNDRIQISRSSSRARGFITAGGSTVASLDGGAWADSTTVRIALAYKVNDYAMCLNGGTVVTDTSGALPTGLDVCMIGSNSSGGGFYNGLVKIVAVYNTRLPDTRLRELTV